MDHPKTYLLKKIMGYETNGLNSLGHLNGKHVEDLAKVMQDFAEESIIETMDILNKGFNPVISRGTITLEKPKKRR